MRARRMQAASLYEATYRARLHVAAIPDSKLAASALLLNAIVLDAQQRDLAAGPRALDQRIAFDRRSSSSTSRTRLSGPCGGSGGCYSA